MGYIKTKLLKEYSLNKQFFDGITGSDYETLKEDIEKNGIKTELHILPDHTVLCGHQRLKIALELNLNEIPVKIIDNLKTDEEIKEYVIKDNLLRRHLDTKQKYLLIAELSKTYEIGSGGDRKSEDFKGASVALLNEDVKSKTAKETGESERTIANARKYSAIIEIAPELKDKNVMTVLKDYSIKKDEETGEKKLVLKNKRVEINLNSLNSYDSNMFYTSPYLDKKYSDDLLIIDDSFTGLTGSIRECKDFYPTVTTMSKFYWPHGRELSLREYATVQDFPENFKFVGPKAEIKKQIGNAVSPKMSEYILNKYIDGKTYIELFAGCGGFSVGAHKLGKKCLYANEYDKNAGYSLKLNFPEIDIEVEDIRLINEKEVFEKIGKVDFIMGGPPCQGFSTAGKRIGFKEDARNRLYLEFIRFVKYFQPKQFIMENVSGIITYKDEIVKDFEEIGYNMTVEVVKGHEIGMKQQRVRVFFIGNK